MKDIPIFDTQYGVGSLALAEVSYRQEAYITIGAVTDLTLFLEEAAGFCRAVGAESVYATGHPDLEKYPLYNIVLLLSAAKSKLSTTDATLIAVTEESWAQWQDLYNEKFRKVPNAVTITGKDMQNLLGSCYFVYRGEMLVGIGKADGNRIGAIAAFVPGAGRDVVLALAHSLQSDKVTIEVASANPKAYDLYKRLGFELEQERIKWFKVK